MITESRTSCSHRSVREHLIGGVSFELEFPAQFSILIGGYCRTDPPVASRQRGRSHLEFRRANASSPFILRTFKSWIPGGCLADRKMDESIEFQIIVSVRQALSSFCLVWPHTSISQQNCASQ